MLHFRVILNLILVLMNAILIFHVTLHIICFLYKDISCIDTHTEL